MDHEDTISEEDNDFVRTYIETVVGTLAVVATAHLFNNHIIKPWRKKRFDKKMAKNGDEFEMIMSDCRDELDAHEKEFARLDQKIVLETIFDIDLS